MRGELNFESPLLNRNRNLEDLSPVKHQSILKNVLFVMYWLHYIWGMAVSYTQALYAVSLVFPYNFYAKQLSMP